MPPARGYVPQRFQDEAAAGHLGMGKPHIALLDPTAIVDQVDIQGPGSIGVGTLAPVGSFYRMQKCQQSKGLEIGLDHRHRIHEGRVRGIGPSFGFVKGRNAQDRYPRFFEVRQRRFEGRQRSNCRIWNIRA